MVCCRTRDSTNTGVQHSHDCHTCLANVGYSGSRCTPSNLLHHEPVSPQANTFAVGGMTINSSSSINDACLHRDWKMRRQGTTQKGLWLCYGRKERGGGRSVVRHTPGVYMLLRIRIVSQKGVHFDQNQKRCNITKWWLDRLRRWLHREHRWGTPTRAPPGPPSYTRYRRSDKLSFGSSTK